MIPFPGLFANHALFRVVGDKGTVSRIWVTVGSMPAMTLASLKPAARSAADMPGIAANVLCKEQSQLEVLLRGGRAAEGICPVKASGEPKTGVTDDSETGVADHQD